MGESTVEQFLPHTTIPPKAIIEFLVLRCPPSVPDAHRDRDTEFFLNPENLRPVVEREGDFLTIKPADERAARRIDMTGPLEGILDQMSKFNREKPFPSVPGQVDDLDERYEAGFPEPGRSFVSCLDNDPSKSDSSSESEAGRVVQNAAHEHVESWDLVRWFFSPYAAPCDSGAQWHNLETRVGGPPTPLPHYESPSSLSADVGRDNESPGVAAEPFNTPVPEPLRSLEDESLSTTKATEAHGRDEHATATNSSASVIPDLGSEFYTGSKSAEAGSSRKQLHEHDDEESQPSKRARRSRSPPRSAELGRDNESPAAAAETSVPVSLRFMEDQALATTQAAEAYGRNKLAAANFSSASIIPDPRTMVSAAEYTFQAHSPAAGNFNSPATVLNSAPAEAPAPNWTMPVFRASMASQTFYTGPPEKRARKAPRKAAPAKSTKKAAGKSALK